MIADYTAAQPYHVKNLMQIVARQLKISGFIVGSLYHKYEDAFYAEMPARVKRGEVKYLEDVSAGLAHAAQGLVDVLTGGNVGKKVILVARE